MAIEFPVGPEGATTPQKVLGQLAFTFGQTLAEAWHLKFLQAEEGSTRALMGMYADARAELEQFMAEGSLTPSDVVFYRNLIAETDRVAAAVQLQAAKWNDETIAAAQEAGYRTVSPTVVPQRALKALSSGSLDLITQTSQGIRDAIRQEIALGILEGLPASEVRKRILATGLTNIPFWPSVEYRAGVIARTETMRAYNSGIVDGIASTGASFVRWLTAPDEAVCPICLPREGVVFRLADVVNDPYPDAEPLPEIPAHPRCRCTVVAEYRRPDGSMIDSTPEVAPKLPSDAMGGDQPGIVPMTQAQIEALAGARWEAARLAEPGVSAGLKPFLPTGAEMAGFESRLKSLDSFLTKIRGRMRAPGAASADGTIGGVNDLIRYTFVFSDASYAADALTVRDGLLAAGYTEVKWQSYWGADGYKGVNTNWLTPDGQIFELQFHTAESLVAKNLVHTVYDLQKLTVQGSPEWDAYQRQIDALYAPLVAPPGATTGLAPFNTTSGDPTSAEKFYGAFEAAFPVGSRYEAYVTHYTLAEMEAPNFTPISTNDGKTGAIVIDHGDGRIELSALFNTSGIPGAGVQLLADAITTYHVNYVECFGPFLNLQYESVGFHDVDVFPFDPAQAPSTWNYANDQPDYHVMHT